MHDHRSMFGAFRSGYLLENKRVFGIPNPSIEVFNVN
jgi:hypothetical protein